MLEMDEALRVPQAMRPVVVKMTRAGLLAYPCRIDSHRLGCFRIPAAFVPPDNPRSTIAGATDERPREQKGAVDDN